MQHDNGGEEQKAGYVTANAVPVYTTVDNKDHTNHIGNNVSVKHREDSKISNNKVQFVNQLEEINEQLLSEKNQKIEIDESPTKINNNEKENGKSAIMKNRKVAMLMKKGSLSLCDLSNEISCECHSNYPTVAE